jgi:hypothetical protein
MSPPCFLPRGETRKNPCVHFRKKPPRRFLKVDNNEGAKDLCDNWSIGGRTRHVELKQIFLGELKESKTVNTDWIPREEMTSDPYQTFATRSLIR